MSVVALTGGSSNFADRVRRLASELPSLLRQRLRSRPKLKRQVQRRLTPEQVERLVAEYEAGDSMQKLSKRWGLHRTTVAEHLSRAGVSIRRRGIPAERLDEVIRLYRGGHSLMRLSKQFGCSAETIRQALLAAGVQMRARWERSPMRPT